MDSVVPHGYPVQEPITSTPSNSKYVDSPSYYPSSLPSNLPSIESRIKPTQKPYHSATYTPSTISFLPTTATPTFGVSDFCYEVLDNQCQLCEPFQSPDYCPLDESFASLVTARTKAYKDPKFDKSSYWFPYLNDKIGAHLFTSKFAPTPSVYCCLTDASDLPECLNENVPRNATGYVIKATHLHTSQGVYVLVRDQSHSDPYEVLREQFLSISTIVSELSVLGDTQIIVEELIGNLGRLEAEYKVHAFPGKVVAIDVVDRRTPGCECIGIVDTAWNRLDEFGCFVPSGVETTNADNTCHAIDFEAGAAHPGPVKNHLNLCGPDLPRPVDDCLWQDMISIAERLSLEIGVYLRIDMFVASDGTVYVQEYAPDPIHGLRHCVAVPRAEDDCIDSCVLGREWKAAGLPYGGRPTPLPESLRKYSKTKKPADQCKLLMRSTSYDKQSFSSHCKRR
jgi:hypothetical protein